MSKTAKAFFGGSVILSAFTVWGVHYLQKRESDTMYLGVLRDEARLRAKAAEKQALESLPSASSIDPDCPVCVISPPPQLLQNLSPEDRRKDREDRKKEYENQKVLAGTLSVEQGVSERWV
ncbi:hypothetical protein TREMEDRAFT_30169 [Tremella mesenterica DSM 1558]|uniref:uncharacterized protein n=1 Tax=Tremella mesenterica (strain ATCC 24925 / CBS 8224 / DSM 1558 / NBRC 9311 / NRRL Y-6157 / RJB 2259-6 / UBC 559-6) TaxID=578456 RepID=UPI0003F4984A|nr:uncharacterized protein TREMEDRAFT_30169 [Tremella mesenterica DSM 1558]EIW70238.1 hypothetical protein TREMEDRAFT_30169 [Tremella mesenterica DSM 1558]